MANEIFKVVSKIQKAIKDAVKPSELRPLGQFVVETIVKRTRLGYGVRRNFGEKEKLKPLSKKYIEKRKNSRDLDNFARPKFSNLTFTGQMLNSVKVLKISPGRLVIGPFGDRREGRISNAKVAEYQEKQGRTFNRISRLEYQQALRFYRRTFGDLLRRKSLIR